MRLEDLGDRIRVQWIETVGTGEPIPPQGEGFGSHLERASVSALRGAVDRNWHADGLAIDICFPRDQLLA